MSLYRSKAELRGCLDVASLKGVSYGVFSQEKATFQPITRSVSCFMLLAHLLNRPIKVKSAACSRRRRIYLSCSNWLIVAVRRWDWVVHHVRLRAAGGEGAAAKRVKLPVIRCKVLRGLKVAGSVFIESTGSELICFSEVSAYRPAPGTALGKVKETCAALLFFLTLLPFRDEFLFCSVDIIPAQPLQLQ